MSSPWPTTQARSRRTSTTRTASCRRRSTAHLVERIYQVVRLAGLPLAMGTGDAGVYLEREDPISGPISYVVISWHTTDRLFDTSEETPGPRAHAADKLLSAACPAIEDALEKILAAGGLVVAKHPETHSLAVWAAPATSHSRRTPFLTCQKAVGSSFPKGARSRTRGWCVQNGTGAGSGSSGPAEPRVRPGGRAAGRGARWPSGPGGGRGRTPVGSRRGRPAAVERPPVVPRCRSGRWPGCHGP